MWSFQGPEGGAFALSLPDVSLATPHTTADGPQPRPAHAREAQAGKCAPTDTHVHTHTCKGVAQTRHNRGRTSAHAHTAGQTGTSSPSRGPRGRRGAGDLELPGWGHLSGSRGRSLHWGWSRGKALSAAQHRPHSAPPGPLVATPGSLLGAPGFVGHPTTAGPGHGIEFSMPFALRGSMPLGGKYQRCLCLKPIVGVSESPGLCPSVGQTPGHRGLGRNER